MIVREVNFDDLETIVKLKYMMFVDAQLEHLLSEDFNKLVFNEYTKLYSKKLANHFIIENDNKIVAISGGFIGDMNTLKEYRRQVMQSYY